MKLRPDGILDPFGNYPNPFNGRPYTNFYLKQAFNGVETDQFTSEQKIKGWSGYKTYLDRFEIFKKIHQYQIILVIAGTGVGKTVIIPKLLAHYYGYQKPIIITTPKQTTTSSAAEWASITLDVPLYYYQVKDGRAEFFKENGKNKATGMTFVGYRFGGMKEKLSSPDTKLLYATDGLIKQIIISSDPLLSEYGGIIIDEAHERSVSIDILISLITEIARKRPDFKIIIMSATVNEKVFIDYFNNSGLGDYFTTYNVEGTKGQFPVEHKFLTQDIPISKSNDELFKIVNNLLMNPDRNNLDKNGKYQGDILVFVTSSGDGNKIKKKIDDNLKNYPDDAKPFTLMLEGSTKTKEPLNYSIALEVNGLDKVPKNRGIFQRKVIMSTDVAESSVTFGDPIIYVVDSGLAYKPIYDPVNYCIRKGKVFVAQANIKQRCGRTGRISKGFCYRGYSEKQFTKEFDQYPPPSILKEDITGDILGMYCLKGMGTKDKAEKFIKNMVEPFENYEQSYNTSINNLIEHNMLNMNGDLTIIGAACNQFGKFDHKIGKMIIGGYYLGVMPECIALGAILSQGGLDDPIGLLSVNAEREREIGMKILKKFEIEYSDHLTILNIYIQWSRHKNNKNFANENKLNTTLLNRIKNTCTELQEIITKRLFDDIPDLELFKVIGDKKFLFGGSNEKKYNRSNIHTNAEATDYRLDGGYNRHVNIISPITSQNNNEDQEVHKFIQRAGEREREEITGGDEKETRYGIDTFLNKYNLIGGYDSNNFAVTQDGGKKKRKKKKKPITQKLESKSKSEKKMTKKKITVQSKLIASNKSIPSDYVIDKQKTIDLQIEKIRIKSGDEKGKLDGNNQEESKRKKIISSQKTETLEQLDELKDISIEPTKVSSVENYQLPIVKIVEKKDNKKDPMLFQDLSPEEKGKAKKNEFFKDKEVQRRHKLINEYTLSNIPRRKVIKPFEENYLNVLACLLYGYSTQLAIFSGKENKYIMKYSLLTPTLSDNSLLQLREDKPNVILYKECQTTSYGGKENVNLYFNSTIPNKVLTFFLSRTES